MTHRAHISRENGHRKRIFSKTHFRVEILKNAGLSITCGRTKTEFFFKNDDVIHHILLALRMLCEGFYRISIVAAFSCGRANTLRVHAYFFANGEQKITVFKHNRIRVNGDWVRVAWNCIVGLFCDVFLTHILHNFPTANKRSDSVPQNNPIVQLDSTLTQSHRNL